MSIPRPPPTTERDVSLLTMEEALDVSVRVVMECELPCVGRYMSPESRDKKGRRYEQKKKTECRLMYGFYLQAHSSQ